MCVCVCVCVCVCGRVVQCLIVCFSTVCRDNELMVDDETNPTVLQICLEDQWLTLGNSLQLINNDFPVTNLQLNNNENGVSLSWDRPIITNEDMEITSFDVVCSTAGGDVQHSSSRTVSDDGATSSTFLPLLARETINYMCCVTTNVRGNTGVRFSSETCETSLFIPPPSCPPTAAPARDDSILVLILGVLAGLFFLALIIVSIALVAFICAGASRRKGSFDAVDAAEFEMKA